MADNQIDVSSVGDSRITKYSSVNINKSLGLARKISNSTAKEGIETLDDSLRKLRGEDFDPNESAMLTERIIGGRFDFNDFMKQIELLNESGSLANLLRMIPGIGKLSDSQLILGEDQLRKAEIIISLMTKDERTYPYMLAQSISRRQRIAENSGYSESDIQNFIAEFKRMRSTMQQMSMGNFPVADDKTNIDLEKDAEYYCDLGIEKYELEDYRSAIDNFTQSIRLDPNYAEAYWRRAGAKYYSGNYQAAIDDYTQSIKLNPDCVDSYNLRAVTKYELEDYQGAIDDITQSIKLDPENDYSAYSFRANTKEKLGDYQAAIDDYDLAIYKCKDKGKSFQPLLHSRDQLINKL